MEIVTLLRQQAELEFRILAGQADTVATERELESTRRRLIAHPGILPRGIGDRPRAPRRSPDMVSVRDVTAFGGSN
jgi:hypothetical protein